MTIGKSTISALIRYPVRPGPGCCRMTEPTAEEVEMSPSLVGLFTGGRAHPGPRGVSEGRFLPRNCSEWLGQQLEGLGGAVRGQTEK